MLEEGAGCCGGCAGDGDGVAFGSGEESVCCVNPVSAAGCKEQREGD